MRNYALDTKLLPKVWITWPSIKNGEFDQRHWLNCQTGKKKTAPEPWMYYVSEVSVHSYPYRDCDKIPCGINYKSQHSDKIWLQSGCHARYAYAKYHADIDRLEIAVVGIDTTRKLEPHPWHFIGGRFFIGKDKSIIDQNGNDVRWPASVYEYHSVYNGRTLISTILRLTPIKGFVDEFKKFIGANNFTIGDGSTETISNTWHLQRWYDTVQKVRGKGKQQKLTDELTSIELSDAGDFAERYPEVDYNPSGRCGWNRKLSSILYYENVNDEWDVLRKFARTSGQFNETQRIYICKDGNVRVASNSNGTWIPSKYTRSNGWYGQGCYFANKDEAIAQCNQIKYILSSADDVDISILVDFLVMSLRFPEIEQIAKLGYLEQVRSLGSSHTIKADLKYMFGGYYDDKEKNILRKVGMTKHQFDTYMSNDHHRKKQALSTMRKMFGNNLTYLDNASFDKYFNGCIKLCNGFWRTIDAYADIVHFDEMRFFKNLARLSEKREDVFNVANDTLQSYISLNFGTAPEIDWYFDDVSDLIRAHDAIVELRRMQQAERQARYSVEQAERAKKDEERRAKIDEKRKSYEYEDDKYIIRLPKDLAEIVREGSTQRICIGGYTSRHANGETNLFFLREKENDDIPFYAIEMDNQKQIRQIHGFGNKWLGNDPDTIPTVVRWLRKNGIKCDEKILTCKAHGYGRINEYVDMPVVD